MTKRKQDRGLGIYLRNISPELQQQVRLEAEAAGVTVRVWCCEILCRACGLDPANEPQPMMGRPTEAKRQAKAVEEESRQQAKQQGEDERRRSWQAFQQRTDCRQPGHKDGEAFLCKLPRGHAGDCSPHPVSDTPDTSALSPALP